LAEFVLPFVVRIERATPPARTDALEAAARGVLLMLTADRPEWAAAIQAWDGAGGTSLPRKRGDPQRGRIRKVVRRARGAEWRRALTVDGLDVVHGSAEVRVYPPIPVGGGPPPKRA